MDLLYSHGDPIYDMDGETFSDQDMNLNLPFSINLYNRLIEHDQDIAYLISYELVEPKDVNIYDSHSIISQHSCVLINGVYFL